jgi:hypothetical protein
MNLLLKPEHQQLIEAQLKTGRYQIKILTKLLLKP